MAELAFVLLLVSSLAMGGGAALADIPQWLEAMTPAQKPEAGPAQAGLPGPGVARFAIPDGFAASRTTPQVLYPVPVPPKPAWALKVMPSLRGETSTAPETKPVIAICIDDLGQDLAGTDKAMALPRDVAVSFLPFADTTPFLAEAAQRGGHLVLAHVPMQALNGTDPGPMALKPGMAAAEIASRLGWNLARVPGLVGINNHEGSLFTADAKNLAPVMAMLRARRLFFFDSRTSAESAAVEAARGAGVMTAARDVFLDDDPQPQAVRAQLDRLEGEARRNGVAIAIGHPHDVTLQLLAKWLAEDHGVTLVPLDEAIRRKAERVTALAAR
jgi:hypothetical protein